MKAGSGGVRAYDFRQLEGMAAAALASTMVGVAVELVRDGFVVTRQLSGDIVVLRWTAKTQREPNPFLQELFARH